MLSVENTACAKYNTKNAKPKPTLIPTQLLLRWRCCNFSNLVQHICVIWIKGQTIHGHVTLTGYAVIQPPTDKETQQLPLLLKTTRTTTQE